MSYQAVIVDDDPRQAAATRAAVERSSISSRLGEVLVLSPEEVSSRCADGWNPDVALLDIELGDDVPNGIELARSLFPAGSGTQVIFVTGFIEYCTRVYATEHIWFLVKPFSQADLDVALAHAIEVLGRDVQHPIALASSGKTRMVPPRQILFVESNRRKLHVHTTSETIEIYGSLELLERALPGYFVRCHKSFLVNMEYIDMFDTEGLHLAQGQVIPVSQKRRSYVKGALLSFLRE